MPTLEERLEAATAMAEAAAAKLRAIVHGAVGTEVETDNGDVPSVATAVDAIGDTVIEAAEAAKQDAVDARDAAQTAAGAAADSQEAAATSAAAAAGVLADAALKSNNLSDLANIPAALANLGGLATDGDGSALTGLTGDQIAYDNVASGLVATDAQAALDELAARGLLQVVTASYSTSATLTATIPDDNTTPLVSEGAELLSATITPVSDSSVVLIRATIPMVAVSTSNAAIAALFVGSTCVNIAYLYPGAGNNAGSMVMGHYFAPGSLDPVTISVRIGATSATIYVNRTAGNTLGGASKSTLVIEEVAA